VNKKQSLVLNAKRIRSELGDLKGSMGLKRPEKKSVSRTPRANQRWEKPVKGQVLKILGGTRPNMRTNGREADKRGGKAQQMGSKAKGLFCRLWVCKTKQLLRTKKKRKNEATGEKDRKMKLLKSGSGVRTEGWRGIKASKS